ncbi:Duplicated ATPase component of energizing module of predicted ECF transporter [Mammaliicoccus lentus]|uniref:ABC transporter ATP-binding protein n=1 Tax=Mammaliicoccus lentus TaxID=42858 RepID=UPI0039E85203
MIKLENVSFSYENEENVLKNINLQIDKNELICLSGMSGCGKTTLTRIFNGLIPHFYEGKLTGDIIINNKNMKNINFRDISLMSGSVFQNPRSQFFCLNTTNELAFEAENIGMTDILEKIHTVVEDTNIEHLIDRNIFKLSGGEKQIIACSAISIVSHNLIILDEPTSNLDFEAIQKLKKLIIRWKAQGKTIIVAEHRLYYLADLIDRLVVMEKGTIIHTLTNEEIQNYTNKDFYNFGLRAPHLKQIQGVEYYKETLNNEFYIFEDIYFGYKSNLKNVLSIGELKLRKGAITTLIGENGAGKTTLARCLTGLEKKFKGKLKDNQKIYHDLRKTVFMVFQEVSNQLFAETVLEEVEIASGNKDSQDECEDLLEQLNLIHLKDKHPQSLSGGEQQRVAIATAIASKRKIIILDEPTSGLDHENMMEVASILKKVSKENNISVLLITHDYEFLMACSNEIILLESGKIKSQSLLNSSNLDEIHKVFKIKRRRDE